MLLEFFSNSLFTQDTNEGYWGDEDQKDGDYSELSGTYHHSILEIDENDVFVDHSPASTHSSRSSLRANNGSISTPLASRTRRGSESQNRVANYTNLIIIRFYIQNSI